MIKLGFRKYTLRPESLAVMIRVEKMAKKPIYEINNSLQDQLVYMYAMFRCAGFRLGWLAFNLLLTNKVVEDVLKFYAQRRKGNKTKSKDGDTDKISSSENVSAHEMLMQYSIVSGLPPNKIIRMQQMELDAILTAFERTRRESWEQARLMAFCAIAPHLEGKPKIHNWLPLAWEKFQPNADVISREKYDELIKKNSDAN